MYSIKTSTIVLLLFVAVLPVLAKDYFISPDGDDKNNGEDIQTPFASLSKAQTLVKAGDIVYIAPGTYHIDEKQVMSPVYDKTYTVVFLLDKSGMENAPISYIGIVDKDGNRPVFDFSAIKPKSRVTGFLLRGNYLYLKNIETVGIQVSDTHHTQSENFRILNASNNILENIAAHDGMGIGFYLIRKCVNNYFINCDAYNNYDSLSENGKGGNTDGFGCHTGTSDSYGNTFIGCRAWYNSDDGFDLINAQSAVNILYCIAYKNGYALIDGVDKKIADGNGFKCGGYGMNEETRVTFKTTPMHAISNCIAAENRSGGFYSNHHLGGLHFSHCSAYRNNGANFNMKNRKDATIEGNVDVNGYDHIIEGCLSYGFHATKSDKHLIYLDGDNTTCKIRDNSFTWNSQTKKWDNDERLNTTSFTSLNPEALVAPRSKDGMLTSIDFLKLVNSTYGCDFSEYHSRVEKYRK